MTSVEFVKFALQIAITLGWAVLFGQLIRMFKQPVVLGEMIGGIILGPTIFGVLLPGGYEWLFKSSINITVARDAAIKLGMLFFLFIAGIEIDLSDLKTLGRKALLIGLVGTLGPIASGVALVYALPHDFWGSAVQTHFFSFALFVGMNLANSANPVLARILIDLGLLNQNIGMIIALIILVVASVSEGPGIHAFLGAFLVGAALSGHNKEHQETHDVLMRFSLSFFAPIYFISMGMTTNFITNFDAVLVMVILVAALISKLGAVLLGARLAGMPLNREILAIGFGLNARGATGIILAGVGRTAGAIDDASS